MHPEAAGTPEENFSIAIPPPNVTGALHMGHALNWTIQDVLIRTNRMRGRRAKWILGTDHAGIATQRQVEKLLESEGTSRVELGREAFVRARLGVARAATAARSSSSASASARRPTTRTSASRWTSATSQAVLKVFVELYEQGLIYRDHYMVNWDPGPALGDLRPRGRGARGRRRHAVLDRLPAGLRRAASSSSRRCARRRCSPTPRSPCTPTTSATRTSSARRSILPLVGRRLPIIADEYVKTDFGTGALKITPGHDPNDFEIGRRHGLEEISVIGEDGLMTAAAGRYAGLTVDEAQRARRRRPRGARARSARARSTSTPCPFSQRSGERVEPLISLQWFMRMDELAGPAIDAVNFGHIKIHPESQSRRYLDWLENIRPWCISRQLWWGHQIPVWYRGEETYVGATPPEGDGWEQDPDVLDTWFSLGAVAVRHAGLARAHARAARLLSDRRALDGARHPVSVGRADGDAGAALRRRHPVRARLRALDHPGPRRPADEQVAGHRRRPARPRRRRPAAARVPAGRRVPRLRRRRRALRPAGDVLHAGRALQRGEDRRRARRWPTSSTTRRASSLLRVGDGRRRPAPQPRDRRGPLDPLAPAGDRGRDAGAHRRLRLRARPRWASTTSSTASCATGTWSSSSRAWATTPIPTTARRSARRCCTSCARRSPRRTR